MTLPYFKIFKLMSLISIAVWWAYCAFNLKPLTYGIANYLGLYDFDISQVSNEAYATQMAMVIVAGFAAVFALIQLLDVLGITREDKQNNDTT
jgi:hypothetical protein